MFTKLCVVWVSGYAFAVVTAVGVRSTSQTKSVDKLGSLFDLVVGHLHKHEGDYCRDEQYVKVYDEYASLSKSHVVSTQFGNIGKTHAVFRNCEPIHRMKAKEKTEASLSAFYLLAISQLVSGFGSYMTSFATTM